MSAWVVVVDGIAQDYSANVTVLDVDVLDADVTEEGADESVRALREAAVRIGDKGWIVARCDEWLERHSRASTPHCDHWAAHFEDRERIVDFLEWIEHEGYQVCERLHDDASRPPEFWDPIIESHSALLDRYHKIDRPALEAERRRLLESLRPQQDTTTQGETE